MLKILKKKMFLLVVTAVFTVIVSEPDAISNNSPEVEIIPVLPAKLSISKPKKEFFGFEKEIIATAYTSEKDALTFTETTPGLGTIAVDPKKIPLGSTVIFPDIFPDQKFLAVDTGKKIKGWKIDV